jgi:hypothetical protein
VDEGSEDENVDKNANEDPQALSSKECDFRETILKQESKDSFTLNFNYIGRRKRKEKKQREKEAKKLRALNGEDS